MIVNYPITALCSTCRGEHYKTRANNSGEQVSYLLHISRYLINLLAGLSVYIFDEQADREVAGHFHFDNCIFIKSSDQSCIYFKSISVH